MEILKYFWNRAILSNGTFKFQSICERYDI
jgi:hypothetical protein